MRRAPHTGLLVLALGTLMLAPVPGQAEQAPLASGDPAQLLGVLQSDAALYEKAKACQQLAIIGNREAVPVLAKLLGDEQLAGYARFALEPIPDPAVDEALREALGKLQGKLLVGVVNSIGVRRDPKAIDSLSELLQGSDLAVAAAAAAALGRIHSHESLEALRAPLEDLPALRPDLGAAALTGAEMLLAEGHADGAIEIFDLLRQADMPQHVKMAALEGAIRARGPQGVTMALECLNSSDAAEFAVGLASVPKLPGAELTAALVDLLPKLVASGEATAYLRPTLLVHALGARGDKAAFGAIRELAQRGPAPVRLAAVCMLGKLGDPSVLPVLLETMLSGQENLAQAARESLAQLPGAEIDAALVAALEQSQGTQLTALIELVGQRGIAAATPALERLADRDDATLREAATRALALTVGPEQLPAMIQRLLQAQTPEETAALKESLRKACLRMPDRNACAGQLIAAMGQASVPAQGELLSLLGTVGGEVALKAVTQSAREGSDAIQDSATRTLGEWMSPEAAPVLLELATAEQYKYALRALRGYIRIARQLPMPPEERLAMCRTALAASGRPEEKRLVLEAYTRAPSAEALAELTPYLQVPELKETAATAAVAIGQKIVKEQPAAVAATMPQVLQASDNADVKAKAQALVEQTRQ